MLESDSNIDVKICSVIRGMIPASSGESMSAPFIFCERAMRDITTQPSYHHGKGLARSSLPIGEDSSVVAIKDIYPRHIVRKAYRARRFLSCLSRFFAPERKRDFSRTIPMYEYNKESNPEIP